MKWSGDKGDTRNYNVEAQNLIRKLKNSECYQLYEIVLKKQKMSNSETRDLELNAVRSALENRKGLDEYKMYRILNGYKSEMAKNAIAKDGNARVSRKKV